jgi:hypothetical protein
MAAGIEMVSEGRQRLPARDDWHFQRSCLPARLSFGTIAVFCSALPPPCYPTPAIP